MVLSYIFINFIHYTKTHSGMKPVLSFLALVLLAATSHGRDNKVSDHIKDSGPNPMCFDGGVATAKVYTQAADGSTMPNYIIYTFKDNNNYSMDVFSGDERINHEDYITNADGTRQNKITQGEYAERRNRIFVLQDGRIVREVYTDVNKDETRTLKTFSYDGQGRLSTIAHMDGNHNAQQEHYTYEGNTIIRRIIDTDRSIGRTDTYELDEHHNPVKITITDGWQQNKDLVFNFEYTYDEKGNYTQVKSFRNGQLMATQYREIQYN